MGEGVVRGFELVIDGDGGDQRFALFVSADHHHHAEFTDRVGKCDRGAGENADFGVWDDDSQKRDETPFSQRVGDFDEVARHGGKGTLDGSEHKRQRKYHTCDHQALEGKDEFDSKMCVKKAPYRAHGRKRDEKIKAKHGRRQHERHRGDDLHHAFEREIHKHERVGDGDTDEKKQDRGDECELKGEHESGDKFGV